MNKPGGNCLIRGLQAVWEVARTKDWVLGKWKEALSVGTCFWGPQLPSVLLFFLWSQGVGLCLHKHCPTHVVGFSVSKVWGWVTWSWQYSQVYGFCMPFVIVSSTSVTLFLWPHSESLPSRSPGLPLLYTQRSRTHLSLAMSSPGQGWSWPVQASGCVGVLRGDRS